MFTALFAAYASAFVTQSRNLSANKVAPMKMGFGLGDEPERPRLTRETEPEEFFATDMDKMSDEEKLPVAIAGFAFISLPFLAGMIALYAAK